MGVQTSVDIRGVQTSVDIREGVSSVSLIRTDLLRDMQDVGSGGKHTDLSQLLVELQTGRSMGMIRVLILILQGTT